MFYQKHHHHSALAIPQGMNRLDPQHSRAVQGGKRREGAFLNRAVYGLLAAMIFLPSSSRSFEAGEGHIARTTSRAPSGLTARANRTPVNAPYKCMAH